MNAKWSTSGSAKLVTPGHLVSKCTESDIRRLGRAGDDEYEVARTRACQGRGLLHLVESEEASGGRPEVVAGQLVERRGRRVQGDVDQPLRSTRLRELDQLVELPPGVSPRAGHAEPLDDAPAGSGGGEHAEFALRGKIGQVRHFQSEAEVGLVAREAVHRLLVAQTRERRDDAFSRHELRQHRRIEVLDEAQHVVLLDEAHLEVELGVLGLSVGPGVLVPEAAGDLEVLVHARDHEELLELLRRLGQGVELPRIEAAGNEVVPGAFRSALDQDGGLDLEETAFVQEVPDVLDHPVPKHDSLLHAGTAKVDVPVLQTQELVHLRVIANLEWGRLRLVEHLG